MAEPKEHTERRNFLEEVLRRIPGFRGYLEKEYRRESDQLQREWLADRLARGKRGVDELTRALVDAGQIDPLPRCEQLRGKLDQLIGRIRGAMQGYSGVFDLVRIDEAVLDRVYQHDLALMQDVEALAAQLEQLGADPPAGVERLPEISRGIDALAQAWDDREDLLKGVD